MILFFTDRRLNVVGQASTHLPKGLKIVDDMKTEDVDTGIAVLECTLSYSNMTEDERELVSRCATVGNYILRQTGDKEKVDEFYTIIESEEDTKSGEISIYAEDAGLDLLNEIVGAYEATEAKPISFYINQFAYDTGFGIGINEIPNLTRKLKWEDAATITERLLSVATQFDNCELSFSFKLDGFKIKNKFINIHKRRGKDLNDVVRLNKEVDSIVTTKSIANLATALRVTGGTPEQEEPEEGEEAVEPTPITLDGYKYDDGDFFLEGTYLKSRKAVEIWSRYLAEEGDYTGHICKRFEYDTIDQAELCNRAIAELKKLREIEVNYEVDITRLPESAKLGDRVNIVDDAGGLYLSARILKLEISESQNTAKATLGEYLIKSDGISQRIAKLAEHFEKAAASSKQALFIANNAKAQAKEAQTQANTAAADASKAQQAATTAESAAQQATASAENAEQQAAIAAGAVEQVEQSVAGIEQTVENANAAAEQARQAAATAETKATEAQTAARESAQSATVAEEAAEQAKANSETAISKADGAKTTAEQATTEAAAAKTTAEAAKLDAEQAEKDVATFGENLTALSNTMQADYARKTELTETESSLQSQISQNAEQIQSTVTQVTKIDETANNAAQQASQAQQTAATAQQQANKATEDAETAQQVADAAALAAGNAQSEADKAKAAAATAQSVADKAEDDLKAAQADLATVQGRVDATEEDIATAQQAVETAQAAANKAKADAADATAKANAAQGTADTAVANAATAQTKANEAAQAAALAQETANGAKGDAAAAKKAADDAADAAATAQTTANTAKTNAETAQGKANEAAAAAVAAQTAADNADAKAQQAAADLAAAEQNLADVTSRVDATEGEVEAAKSAVVTAQNKANEANAAAVAAQSAADTAKADAAKAQTDADNAKKAADEAQKAADDAQKAADDAQDAVDALAVRVTKAETSITQTSEQIKLLATKEEVTQTLGGYYTKEETDAAITVKADEITSEVSRLEEEFFGENIIKKTNPADGWQRGWSNPDADYAEYAYGRFNEDIVEPFPHLIMQNPGTFYTGTLAGKEYQYKDLIYIDSPWLPETEEEYTGRCMKTDTPYTLSFDICRNEDSTLRNLQFAFDTTDNPFHAAWFIELPSIESQCPADNQWHKVFVQLVIPHNYGGDNFRGGYLTFYNEGVEEAGKTSIIKIANFYLAEQTGTFMDSFTQMGTIIDQTSEQIKLLATKKEVTETLDGYYTKTEADAAIDLKADEINLSVSEVREEVDNINIGGRNLLKNSRHVQLLSNNFSEYPVSVATATEGVREYKRYVRTETTLNPTTMSLYSSIPVTELTENLYGKEMTFSFLIRCSHGTEITTLNSIVIGGTSHVWASLYDWHTIGTDWKRIHVTATIEQEYEEVESNLLRFNPLQINIPDGEIENFYIDVCEWKIEKGNKATDWTPAPEDYMTKTETEATIKVESDKIAAVVSTVGSQGTRISTLEQTADGFSVRLGAVESDVETARSTADSASTAAANAQSTANTAKTNAETAQSKANEAAAAASAAQTAADDADAKAAQAAVDLATAQQNLENVTGRVDATEEEIAAAQAAVEAAQAKADEADAAAAAAQSTAVTAKADAAKAQTDADNAKTAADNAQAAADAAQQAADDAQAAVDALAVRVTKTETDIIQTSEQIKLLATKEEVTETLGGYSTKEETQAAIDLKADAISQTVSNTYATKQALSQTDTKAGNAAQAAANAQDAADNADEKAQAAQNAADNAQGDVDDLADRVTEAETAIEQNASAITLRATKTELNAVDTKTGNAETAAANAQSAADDAQDTADGVATNLANNYYNKTQTEAKIKVEADKIASVVETVDEQGGRISTLEQTADGFSVSLENLEGDVDAAQSTANTAKADAATAQSTANTANSTANTAKSNAATAQTAANNAATAAANAQDTADDAASAAATAQSTAKNAAKTATNFMSYDSTNGLLVGNKSSGAWSGFRAQVLPSSFNVLNASGKKLASYGASEIGFYDGNDTQVASFKADKISLGMNNDSSIIDLCNGHGKMSLNASTGRFTLSSDDKMSVSCYQGTSTGQSAENSIWLGSASTTPTASLILRADEYFDDSFVRGSSLGLYGDCILVSAGYINFTTESYINVDGNIRGESSGVSWFRGREAALLATTNSATATAYFPLIDCKSQTGDWSLGCLGDSLYIVNTTDSNYDSGTNQTTRFAFSYDGSFTAAGDIYVNNSIISNDAIGFFPNRGDSTPPNNLVLGNSGSGHPLLRPSVNNYGYIGGTSYRFATFYCKNAVNVSSDRRLKENITDDFTELEKVYSQLRPVSYSLIGDKEEEIHFGFVAQDIEQAFSETGFDPSKYAVLTKDEVDPESDLAEIMEDGYTYGLGYTEFIALNTHMIQKLMHEVSALKDEISELKGTKTA